MKKKILTIASLIVFNLCTASDNTHNAVANSPANQAIEPLEYIIQGQEQLAEIVRMHGNDRERLIQETQAFYATHILALRSFLNINNLPEQQ